MKRRVKFEIPGDIQGMSMLLTILILSLFIPICHLQAQSHFYYGSLHSHSEYSDGNQAGDPNYRTAKSCLLYADQRALHIDFWGVSDHNHDGAGMQLPDYQKGVLEADSVNRDGFFSSFYGMEWGIISTGGHVIVYGIDSLVGWENGNYLLYNAQQDYGGLFDLIASRGNSAFATLAHMDAGDFGNLLGKPYNAIWDSAITGLAVRSGPAFSTDTTYSDPSSSDYLDRYQEMLAKGYHLGPVMDHDNHYINFGRSQQSRTVVMADTLTRTALLQSFRDMRFYASDDWNAQVQFSVNDRPMGSIFSSDSDAVIKVKITDPDNEVTYRIRIWYGITGSGLVSTSIAQNFQQDSLIFNHQLSPGIPYYYFAEITQDDGQKIWTAPVWYTRTGSPPSFELLSFDAKLIDRKAQLNWSTINEADVSRFEIEKSTDSSLYVFRDSVTAKGGPGLTAVYQWNDPEVLEKSTYYRLSLYDNAGNNTDSYQKRLDPAYNSLSVSIQPSLTGNEIAWIELEHDTKEPLRMEVFSSNGQLVYSSSLYINPGITFLPFDPSTLSNGLYIIRFSTSDYGKTQTLKFVKE